MSNLIIYEYDRNADRVTVREHPLPESFPRQGVGTWTRQRLNESEACFNPSLRLSRDCDVIATAYRFGDSHNSWCILEAWPGMKTSYSSRWAAIADWEKAARRVSRHWPEVVAQRRADHAEISGSPNSAG